MYIGDITYINATKVVSYGSIPLKKSYVTGYRFVYIKSGEGYFLFPHTQRKVNTGEIYLFAPGYREFYYTDRFSIDYIFVRFECAERLIESPYKLCLECGHQRSLLVELLENIILEEDEELRIWEIKLAINIFFHKHPYQGIDSRIVKAIRYLDLNPHENLSVPHLAQIANLSVTHFRRLFEKYTGKNPKSYILKTRMKYARSLLLEKDLLVSEVAEILNCNSLYDFSRQFKQIYGYAPSKIPEV